ncbi:response regulator [Emticicia sp. BO119]|uniref:response regulator n=1 Tax=Emticicia sp. BO119 TaxID=2757768 RepID=UPI0015F102E2|nr:response regulator [Emticicia sp. BO119]MBA4851372.1 response regulator [Emticicia sp. BO119]
MDKRPVILIEDDVDDKIFLEDAFSALEVKHPLIWFDDCEEARDYLFATNEIPFLILCDINLPKQTGIELKREIQADEKLRKKSIPFVFYTTSDQSELVNEAYLQLNVQGYVQKSTDFKTMKRNIQTILDYWALCKHSNNTQN